MASLKEWWDRFFTAIGVTVVCNITVIWAVIWVAFRIGYLDLHSEPSHEVVIDFVPFTLSLVSFVAGIVGSIRWRGSRVGEWHSFLQ